jgi:predicted Zn finger-like uncharacterized protein
MRITCPHCQTVYEVPEPSLGTGRRLRCARCQDTFAVDPPAPPPPVAPPPPDPMPPPAFAAMHEPAAEPRLQPYDRRLPAKSAWRDATATLVASVVLLCALLGAAYVWRAEIMAAWPPSLRLFGLLQGASS